MSEDILENLDERLRKLEQETSTSHQSSTLWIEILKAASPIIAALMVGIMGYLFTGSISNALQQGQLQLSNLREMRDLLVKLGDPKISLDEAMATARTLSSFDRFAVPPFIALLESGSETKILAAEEGLRKVGLSNSTAVCEQLRVIINNRTRLFSYNTHLRAIRLTGQLGCHESIESINKYRALLDNSARSQGFNPLASIFKDTFIDARAFERLSHETSEAMSILEKPM